ncbi:hypothetical protein Tco_1460804 [Tanacetum coccineum]
MFKDKDFEELDDHIENVEEETVDADATGVSTISAPVSTAGVTISTDEPRTPPTTTVFDDEDVTMAMAQTLIKIVFREKGKRMNNNKTLFNNIDFSDRSDKLKPMFKDKDFEELDDHIENVEEETVDADATGVSTISAPVSTAGVTISTDEPRTPPTTIVFDDEDVTMAMAQTLIKMKELKAKEKGVAIIDVEDSSIIVRPVRSITTLQPLPTIDPKDKDAKLAQRLHEEEFAELERAQQERQRQEDDTNAALAKEFDEIQARIDVDHELAVRLTYEEQEKYTIEERARLLAEFFDQKRTSSAPGSCQLPRPDGTHDALSNQCHLVYLDLLLRRCRMASWDSNLVDSFIDHI